MTIRTHAGQKPRLGKNVYVDRVAQVIGDVELGDDLPFVAQIDRHDRVPVMEDRVIRLPRR